MNLSLKQKAMLISLYKRYKESGKRDTFVAAKGVSVSTMKSFYKTGCILSDRVINDVPINMRISDEGIKFVEEYYSNRKKTIDSFITRNKRYIRFVQDTEEKRVELLHYIEGYPIILIKDVNVSHCGYSIFEVNIGNEEPQYYAVYSREEATRVDIGGFYQIGLKPWYVERIRLI